MGSQHLHLRKFIPHAHMHSHTRAYDSHAHSHNPHSHTRTPFTSCGGAEDTLWCKVRRPTPKTINLGWGGEKYAVGFDDSTATGNKWRAYSSDTGSALRNCGLEPIFDCPQCSWVRFLASGSLFRASTLEPHTRALWPWVSNLTSLCLHYLICKMGEIIVPVLGSYALPGLKHMKLINQLGHICVQGQWALNGLGWLIINKWEVDQRWTSIWDFDIKMGSKKRFTKF